MIINSGAGVEKGCATIFLQTWWIIPENQSESGVAPEVYGAQASESSDKRTTLALKAMERVQNGPLSNTKFQKKKKKKILVARRE